ncbi:MAG: hypothetical protein ACLQBQ_05500 [Smithella sp.]
MITENLFWALPVLLGALLTSVITRKHKSKERFNKAAAAFRATFVDEIFRMRRGVDILHGRFGERPEEIAITNEKAKIIFEVYLPQKELVGFNAAWEKYKNPGEINKINCNPIDPEYGKKLGNIYLSHINNLLEYAKPKL